MVDTIVEAGPPRLGRRWQLSQPRGEPLRVGASTQPRGGKTRPEVQAMAVCVVVLPHAVSPVKEPQGIPRGWSLPPYRQQSPFGKCTF